MSEAQTPLARVRLIDGRELVIEPDAARVEDRTHPITRIEEARLLFLQPETIGLRMADVGLVEYTVARAGDGQVALDAIYHLRPDLRRPDLPPPAPVAPAGYLAAPPPAPEPFTPLAPAYPPTAPGGFPPPGAFRVPTPPASPVPFPPHVAQAFGPEPGRRAATLTPQPRGAGQLIRATFRLAGRRFGPLFMVAVLVSLLPNLALGALSVAISVLTGVDPFAAAPNPFTALQQVASGQTPTATPASSGPQTPAQSLAGLLTLVALVAGLLAMGWAVAALTVAARDAALGRRISVAGSAREGLARLWPTLSTLIVTDALLLVVAIPGLGFSLGLILSLMQPQTAAQLTPATGAVVIALAAMTALATLALLAWLWPRLALAPTAAALGMPAPIRTGWSLASAGARRIFLTLLAVGAVTALLSGPATLAQFFSDGLAALALIPLAELIAAPLNALARTLALYDQRLRREGYALFIQEGVTPPAQPAERELDPAAERK